MKGNLSSGLMFMLIPIKPRATGGPLPCAHDLRLLGARSPGIKLFRPGCLGYGIIGPSDWDGKHVGASALPEDDLDSPVLRLAQRNVTLSEKVRQLVCQLLPSSRCSVEQLAARLDMNPKTLRGRAEPHRPYPVHSRSRLLSRRCPVGKAQSLPVSTAPQRKPSFGRTQPARRRIAASASGAVPARNWNTCCISGTISSVTSTPDLRARSASFRLSSSSVSSAPV